MAGQIVWLDGQANNPGSVEKISPERHVRQNQWQSEWNELYLNPSSPHRYDYISDYECIFTHPIDEDAQLDLYDGLWADLQAAKQQGTNVSITSLSHFTTEENAQAIVSSGGFKGGIKKFNEDEEGNPVSANFSWWSPKFGDDDRTTVQNTLEQAISPFLAGQADMIELQRQFATSRAFLPNPQQYGSSYFQYDINNLCDQYGNLFVGEVQFKILGTFGYKQEVMHAVLVCSQENGAGMFNAYPPVLTPEEDVDNEAVVTRDTNGNWIWKPQATATEITRLPDHHISYPNFRRWEHVAFAFHIPDEINQFAVVDPQSHLYEL